MTKEEFEGFNSGEYSEIRLDSYPGETAIGIKFCLVLSPDDYKEFSNELDSLLHKYAL